MMNEAGHGVDGISCLLCIAPLSLPCRYLESSREMAMVITRVGFSRGLGMGFVMTDAQRPLKVKVEGVWCFCPGGTVD